MLFGRESGRYTSSRNETSGDPPSGPGLDVGTVLYTSVTGSGIDPLPITAQVCGSTAKVRNRFTV